MRGIQVAVGDRIDPVIYAFAVAAGNAGDKPEEGAAEVARHKQAKRVEGADRQLLCVKYHGVDNIIDPGNERIQKESCL